MGNTQNKFEQKRRFGLVDTTYPKIPDEHKCHYCKNLIYEVYECKNCSIFCKNHLSLLKNKCSLCGSKNNFEFNQELTTHIKNSYKIKCFECFKEMDLKDLESHDCIKKQYSTGYFPPISLIFFFSINSNS